MGLRKWLAFWLAKSLIRSSRMLGRGGSSLPGRFARLLAPDLPSALAAGVDGGVVLVSGTNGKTTTSRMLVEMLAAGGRRVAHNRTGANLMDGIAAGLIESSDWQGRAGDLAVLETDEATVPAAARALHPRGLVVTNFFRDQLDRYGELQTAVELVRKGALALPESGFAALNADDPLAVASGIGSPARLHYYGMDCPALEAEDDGPARNGDAHLCLRCGEPYEYSAVYYAHLGHYRCSCGHQRPEPEIRLTEYEDRDDGVRVRVETPLGPLEAVLPIVGIYNLYNLLAAVTAALALGLPLNVAAEAAARFTPSFGRMESLAVRGCSMMLALVKNPAGFDQVLRTLQDDLAGRPAEEPAGVLFGINDRYADGTDVSWLWDAGLETLAEASGRLAFVGCTGLRADEMALRLKYAGRRLHRLQVVPEPERALDQALEALQTGGRLWILPTYTALLEIRQVLARRGAVRDFWKA